MISYRKDIDGLRAVAIVTVVASHVGLPGWRGGFVGVDVFFVISGYLITSLLLGEAAATARIDLRSFYARRARRLLPALLTVLLTTLLLGQLVLGRLNGEQQGLAKSAVASLLLNANHFFLSTGGSYFDRPAELQPLLHIWSLSLEEQFYLVWPPLLAGLLALRRGGLFERKVTWTAAFTVPLAFALSVWLTRVSPPAAFYLMPVRTWEFALGALLALIRIDPRDGVLRRAGSVLGVLGLAAIAVAVGTFGPGTPFPGGAASLPAIGTMAVILGNSLAPEGAPAALLSARPMVTLGLLSYSWYLWHWPLVAFARSAALGQKDLTRDAVLGMGVALVLAAVTYRWIEAPIRHSPELKRRGSQASLRLAALSTLFCLCVAGAVGAWAKYSPRSSQELRLVEAQNAEQPLRAECNNFLNEEARLPPIESCTAQRGRSTVDAVLWGDSMADHWMPALADAAERLQISVLQLTRDACPPLLGFEIVHSDPAQHGRCLGFQALAFEEIGRLRQEHGLRAVVLSAAWGAAANGPLDAKLETTLARLEAMGLQVLILCPTPTLPFGAPDCLWRREPERCGLPRADFESQQAAASAAIAAATQRHPDVVTVDPTSYLCDAAECPALRGSTILYRDAAHLTAEAAAGFGPTLARALARLATVERRAIE